MGDRVSQDQFDSYIENETEIAVLNSGDGDVVTRETIPMFSNVVDWKTVKMMNNMGI